MRRLLILFFVSIFAFSLFAQENHDEATDTSETFLNNKFFRKKKDFWWDIEHPTIKLSSSITYPSLSSMPSADKFNDMNSLAFYLGNTKLDIKRNKKWELYYPYSQSFLFLENFSSKWKIKDNLNIDGKIWKFGYISADGYSHPLGRTTTLNFIHSKSLNWSRLYLDNSNSELQPYTEQFRFGSFFASGLNLSFKYFSLDFQYQRAMIFPHHKFWYWLGSTLIEEISEELLDIFIKQVINSTPEAAPLVNLLLKSGLSYGLYELRKDKMNWPFNTAAPLMHQGFNIGISFTF